MNKSDIFLRNDNNPDRKAMRSILREVIEDSKEIEKAEISQRTALRLTGILLVIALAIFLMMGCAQAQNHNKIVIKAIKPVDLSIIAIIESSGNPDAYNRHSGAVGLYQITPVCLKDYNHFHKPQRTMAEMKDRAISKNVANWYLNHRIPSLLEAYNIPDSTKNRLWAYNTGIGNVKKGRMPLETKNYINKYEQLKKNLNKLEDIDSYNNRLMGLK